MRSSESFCASLPQDVPTHLVFRGVWVEDPPNTRSKPRNRSLSGYASKRTLYTPEVAQISLTHTLVETDLTKWKKLGQEALGKPLGIAGNIDHDTLLGRVPTRDWTTLPTPVSPATLAVHNCSDAAKEPSLAMSCAQYKSGSSHQEWQTMLKLARRGVSEKYLSIRSYQGSKYWSSGTVSWCGQQSPGAVLLWRLGDKAPAGGPVFHSNNIEP